MVRVVVLVGVVKKQDSSRSTAEKRDRMSISGVSAL
jgi:hypothetical protein